MHTWDLMGLRDLSETQTLISGVEVLKIEYEWGGFLPLKTQSLRLCCLLVVVNVHNVVLATVGNTKAVQVDRMRKAGRDPSGTRGDAGSEIFGPARGGAF